VAAARRDGVGQPARASSIPDSGNDRDELERTIARVAVAHVFGVDGKSTQLRELWRSAPTVTGFVRHYGCIFCHEMADGLLSIAPSIRHAGAQLALIGNGSVEQARRFYLHRGPPREGVHVLTDPERQSYDAAGFERSFTRTFLDGDSRRAYSRARSGGFRITGWFGDLTQLGGVIVTRPPCTPAYLYRSRFAGDHPELAEVLRALAL